MKNLVYLVILLMLFSCNEKKNYKLIIELKTEHNNKFRVYYSKRPYQDIDGQNFIDKYVYSSTIMQKITYDFPEDIVPYKIRFDVGENQNIENIIIKNISVSYDNKVINGDDCMFMNYWSPNECLIFDNLNYYYKIVPSNGKKTPVFMSNIILEEKIKTLRPYIFW